MSIRDELEATIAKIIQPGKGIVAADESTPTITKRFKAVGIDSTEETRRAYRTLLFTTRGVAVVAAAMLEVLRRTIPAAVPTINFLSGGQGPEETTANLNAINLMAPNGPWVLSFSYALALQAPPMHTSASRAENASAAQQAFYRRLKMNSLARSGTY